MAQAKDPVLENFKAAFKKAEDFHNSLVPFWDKGDEAFQAVLSYLPKKNEPTVNQWQSSLSPPYVAQVIEIISSNLIDDEIEADLIPHDPAYEDGAKAHECLLSDQMEKDHFRESVVPYWLQLLVRGITCCKVPWIQDWEQCWYEDENGNQTSRWEVVKDQPGFVTCDIKNIYWDPAASSMKDMRYLFYDTWDTLDNLKELADEGPNGEDPIYKNIDKVKNYGEDIGQGKLAGNPDRDFSNRVRVTEMWTPHRLVVVANMKTVIRDEPNPFIHCQIPFAIATGSPKLFRVEGRSVADFIGDLQKMLWEFMNQKIDNARLMNNAIVLIRESGVDDLKKFQAFPGARWPVMNPQDVKFWEPNPAIIQNSVEIESNIKEDILNLSGAVAYLSGASTESIDNTTATGISIVNSGAQKRLLRIKQQGLFGIERAFNLMIKSNQQLISRPVQLRIQQKFGGHEWIKVMPGQLQGSYEYRVRSTVESLNRQEKRAEISTLIQQVVSNAPIVMQMDPTLEFDFLELFTLLFERYDLVPGKFVKKKQQDPMQQLMGMMQQQSPGQPQLPPPGGNVIPFPQQDQQASGY